MNKLRIRLILLSFTLLVPTLVLGQKITREEYINTYKGHAIKKMKEHGIPASITLAQGILESGCGNSPLARQGNNHFAIKCHKGWTGETIYENDDLPNECFRKYKSAEGSYEDHSLFLRGQSRYAFLFDLPPTDYKAWAKGLKKAGYATAPTYAEMLIKIIEDSKLYQYDTGVEVEVEAPSKGKGKTYGIVNDKGKIVKLDKEGLSGGLAIDDDNFTVDMYKVRKVFIRNRIKYIKVRQGDTFESLTKELHLLPYQLYKYNELSKDSTLHEGQELYIQPKRRKADVHFKVHVVEPGETMYTVSQKYGIKLKHLYRLNRMEPGANAEEGQLLQLRSKKKEE